MKKQKFVPIAAAPKASALDAQLSVAEAEIANRKKRGANQNIVAGGSGPTGGEVLG